MDENGLSVDELADSVAVSETLELGAVIVDVPEVELASLKLTPLEIDCLLVADVAVL